MTRYHEPAMTKMTQLVQKLLNYRNVLRDDEVPMPEYAELRTNMHFTSKTKPQREGDLADCGWRTRQRFAVGGLRVNVSAAPPTTSWSCATRPTSIPRGRATSHATPHHPRRPACAPP